MIKYMVKGLPPVGRDDIKEVLQELGELVKKVCGGEIKAYILDKEVSWVEL
ncbi:MAG: hypothetical protein KKF44_08360 [Nanoarchaeota archaeon]|nr:hypothetical protein [Nanoarchaeota archaeon]